MTYNIKHTFKQISYRIKRSHVDNYVEMWITQI